MQAQLERYSRTCRRKLIATLISAAVAVAEKGVPTYLFAIGTIQRLLRAGRSVTTARNVAD